MPEESQGLSSFGEQLGELIEKLKQSVAEGSEEDVKKALEDIVAGCFEQVFLRAMEQMPEAALKVWIEKPEFRSKLLEIQQECLPTIVEDLPEDWKSDPKFFMALTLQRDLHNRGYCLLCYISMLYGFLFCRA